MYHVIIADDEEAVRRGLINHFNWSQYNMNVVADFPDGEKAWRYIETHPVDLVVTDVRMPNLDGISLACRVRESFPNMQVLFISGYDDTEYLRRAFKTEAVDYILKSIDLDEFAQTIAHVYRRMERETQRRHAMEAMEDKLNESIPLLQQRGLMLLISNDFKYGDIARERLRFLNIPLFDDVRYCLLIVQVRNLWQRFAGVGERQRQLFSLRFINRARAVLALYDSEVLFENRLGEYVSIVNTEREDYEDALLKISQELQHIIEGELDAQCAIGISERFMGLDHVHSAYEGAVNAIVSRFYLNDAKSISVDKYQGQGTTAARERAARVMTDALMSADSAALHSAMADVYADMDALPTPEERNNFLLFLLFLPAETLSKAPREAQGAYADQLKLLEQFLSCADMEARKLFLLGQYGDVQQLLNRRSEDQSNFIVERTRRIIEERYMEQISISSLADQVFLTPTYLCVLFKQATGQTLNEYITQVRIRHAKALLSDSHIRLYDVCTQVGYLSPSYFSRIFKRYTHMTPSEYRDSHMSRT